MFVVEDQSFYDALEDLKKNSQMNEKFDLALYQNGHIDLGYTEEALILDPEQGENFQQLRCVYRDRSWSGKVK